jgi:tetratricopeptide (TPR) repeat protein
MRIRGALLIPVLAAVMGTAAVAGAGVPLTEGWYRVQQALEAGGEQDVRDGVADLQRLAGRVGARRMTAWARAMVLWAEGHQGEQGEAVLELALTLDPQCVEARFLRARWAWTSGERSSAAVDYVKGWIDTVRDPFLGRELTESIWGWLLMGLIVAAILAMTVESTRFLPEIMHDAVELGRLLFSRANALIFAGVVVGLPLFAGLGPAWWLAYLFALAWIYFPLREKIVFGVVWLVLLAAVPLLDVWQSCALADPSPVQRVATALEHGILSPLSIDETMALEDDLRGVAPFHLLAGEALHLAGDSIDAGQQFKRASAAAPDDPLPHLWLGNLAMEEGDVHLAIQQFRQAVQKGSSLGIAYFNLSVALDQDHLFREADEIRSRARALGLKGYPFHYHELDGLRLAYPDDASLLEDRLLREVPAEKRMLVIPPALPMDARSWLNSPWTLAFLSTGLLGLLLWWARRRWMWEARACSRCGKVFCPRCKSSTESSSYCSQCISVFLTRGAVSIDQQAAKVEQIRRRERLLTVVRRVASATLVGSGCLLKGRPLRGSLLMFAASALALGVLAWSPFFAAPMARPAGVEAVQVVLGALFALVWLISVKRGWGGA